MSNNKDYVGYISFSHSLTDRQVHVDSWDEAYLCSEGCGGRLEKLIHKSSGNTFTSREDYNHFIELYHCGNSLDTVHVMIPSDVDETPSYTEEHKREILLDLLHHFKGIRDQHNRSLAGSGERKYCKPLSSISVSDIKDYALSGTGFDEF